MINFSEIPLLILAGGQSNRMGRPKGLLDLHGEPWVLRQAKDYRQIGGSDVVVVTGADSDKYKSLSVDQGASLIHWVHNRDWKLGPFSSLQVGIRSMGPIPEQVFMKPIDVPFAAPSVWRNLCVNIGRKLVATPAWNGLGGHPVLLKKELCERILKIDPGAPHARLDELLRDLGREFREVVEVFDQSITENINNPEQWQRFLKEAH